MEIDEALREIEEILETLETTGFLYLDERDRCWLIKASAALSACKELGGR